MYEAEQGIRRPMTEEEQHLNVSSHCTLEEMVIKCAPDCELSRWDVVAQNEAGLRCVDIFRAIYETYNVPLTPAEKADLESDGYDISRCMGAFRQRCKDTPGPTTVVEQRGICRVDLLRTKRIFLGIHRAKDGTWYLDFEPGRR